MNVMLPALLILTGFVAIATIWRAWVHNRDHIDHLYGQVKQSEYGGEVVVTLREKAEDLDTMFALRRARQLRVHVPKPVTHRLHHFAKARFTA